MAKATFNVTYEIVTPESAEDGEPEEQGFAAEDVELREAVKELTRTRTCHVGGVEGVDFSGRNVRVINSMEFLTGASESRTLHIPPTVTNASAARIMRLLRKRT